MLKNSPTAKENKTVNNANWNVHLVTTFKGPEEFFILEGDLTDPDGYTYKKGDFVHLSSGSLHYSTTSSGCTTVVTHRGKYIFTEK